MVKNFFVHGSVVNVQGRRIKGFEGARAPPGHTTAPSHCQKHPLRMAGNFHKIPFETDMRQIFEIYDRLRSYQTYILVKQIVTSRFHLN